MAGSLTGRSVEALMPPRPSCAELSTMKVISTEDVSLDVLTDLVPELSPEIGLEVSRFQHCIRSFEPPSWVVFLAQCEWWVHLLTGAGAVYGVEFVKEAAKDTYKHRDKIVEILRSGSAAGLRKLAAGLTKLRERLPERTRINIGIPVPDEGFPSTFELVGLTLEDVELQIKIFAIHQPAVSSLIESERLDQGRLCGCLQFALLDDGSLQVSWRDADMNAMARVLPLVLPPTDA
jgi:hypothetical protein